jgi:hypothetical protein
MRSYSIFEFPYLHFDQPEKTHVSCLDVIIIVHLIDFALSLTRKCSSSKASQSLKLTLYLGSDSSLVIPWRPFQWALYQPFRSFWFTISVKVELVTLVSKKSTNRYWRRWHRYFYSCATLSIPRYCSYRTGVGYTYHRYSEITLMEDKVQFLRLYPQSCKGGEDYFWLRLRWKYITVSLSSSNTLCFQWLRAQVIFSCMLYVSEILLRVYSEW